MHDVLASLREGVQSHEESIGGDLPLVLGLCLVLKVGILELGADIKGQSELIMSFLGFFVLDESEDLFSIDVVSALVDDGVTDLSDQNYEAGWRVVVLGVGPDQQDHVHDRHEEIWDLCEILSSISQLVEQVQQSL